MTSAEKKLAEVYRQKKVLEEEEKRFLQEKERTQKNLEVGGGVEVGGWRLEVEG